MWREQQLIESYLTNQRDENIIDVKVVRLNCDNCSLINATGLGSVAFKQMYHPYSYSEIDIHHAFIKNSKVAVCENDKITNIFTNRNLKVLDEILRLSRGLSQDAQNMSNTF